jgi:hypothetical protein
MHLYRESTPAVESSDEDDHSGPDSQAEDARSLCTLTQAQRHISQFMKHLSVSSKARVHSDDPKTFAEAMARPDGDKWYKSTYDEIQALLNNGTWKLAKLPAGQKAIGSR